MAVPISSMLSCKRYTQTDGFAQPGGIHFKGSCPVNIILKALPNLAVPIPSMLSCKHYTQIDGFAQPGGIHFKVSCPVNIIPKLMVLPNPEVSTLKQVVL